MHDRSCNDLIKDMVIDRDDKQPRVKDVRIRFETQLTWFAHVIRRPMDTPMRKVDGIEQV